MGSLHYSVGNAYSALGREKDAKIAYEAALGDPAFANTPATAAQCYKNLGTSLERLGDENNAAELYRKALEFDPNLPEAHNALGNYHHRHGRYEEALAHYDRVIFTDRELGRPSSVAGWRVNIHFILGDGPAAFREINSLIGSADSEPWIWPWCAHQVTSFGRKSAHNARLAVHFWQRYLRVHPEVSAARRELLLAEFFPALEGRERSEEPTPSSVRISTRRSTVSEPMTQRWLGIGWAIGPRMRETGEQRSAVSEGRMNWGAAITAIVLGQP